MKLTGKCKEDFEKWRMKQNYDVDAPFFYDLKYSMQYGVYVDFFDVLETKEEKQFIPLITRGIDYFYVTINGIMDRYNSRPEARTAAIEKANELYNL
jgi:hypothetical protein